MSSLFEKLYRYKQSEQGRHQRENFLTEIFAHCLEFDEIFRMNFLDLIGCTNNCVDFICKTQGIVKGFGIPDVYIEIGNDTKIIIECKVGSTQGEKQLDKYASSLIKDKATNKILIYLTKSPENIMESDMKVNFRHIRWYNIYDLLQKSSNELSVEFSKYLKEHQMNIEMVPFTNKDTRAIGYINDAIVKMNVFLKRLEGHLNTYNLNKFQYPQIKELNEWGSYGIRTNFGEGKLWLGFFQYEDYEETQLCIEFSIPLRSSRRKKINTFLTINSWEVYDYEDETHWYKSKPLSIFITNDNFITNDAVDFIENGLQEIIKWQ
jgi:hypothetical protein